MIVDKCLESYFSAVGPEPFNSAKFEKITISTMIFSEMFILLNLQHFHS